ncbi:MAG: hypothetical protein OEU26_36655 [Candidatus Tectomicrobia bacterium]|nr:hypothetical protein [Candidatus Tectomicrobia bacterium]
MSQIEGDITHFVGDSLYDQAPVYTAVEKHSQGARALIPPRKDAVLSLEGMTEPTQRDQHFRAIEGEGRLA